MVLDWPKNRADKFWTFFITNFAVPKINKKYQSKKESIIIVCKAN